eukprot:1868373-Karenia_brevis.AAC.1
MSTASPRCSPASRRQRIATKDGTTSMDNHFMWHTIVSITVFPEKLARLCRGLYRHNFPTVQ